MTAINAMVLAPHQFAAASNMRHQAHALSPGPTAVAIARMDPLRMRTWQRAVSRHALPVPTAAGKCAMRLQIVREHFLLPGSFCSHALNALGD
jgi:hypothetical protein